MPIDARIALGGQPVALPDFNAMANQRAEMMMNIQQMGQRTRAANQMYELNSQKMIDDRRASMQKYDIDAQAASAAKTKAETEQAAQDRARAMRELVAMETVDQANSVLGKSLAEGKFSKDEYDAFLSALPTDDKDMPAFIVKTLRKMIDPEKQLETQTNDIDAGGSVQSTRSEKYGGLNGPQVTTNVKKTVSPDQLSRNDAASERGADGKKGRTIQSTDNMGNLTTVFAPADGSAPYVTGRFDAAGKPTAAAEKMLQDDAKVLADLGTVMPELDKLMEKGGAIDRAGGGYATIAETELNRAVGRTSQEMAAQAEMDPIAFRIVSLVPRFEGPQSDRDTALYISAAGKLTDPKATKGERRKAAETIKRLYAQRQTEITAKQTSVAGSLSGPGSGSTGGSGGDDFVRDPATGKLVRAPK